jgi:hypothetical protein
MKLLATASVRPGPDQLDAVLFKLELQHSLTVPEIQLRRELRDMLATDEPRESIWNRLWRP